MPESLFEVSSFLVKKCGVMDKKQRQQHTNATENNTFGKTLVFPGGKNLISQSVYLILVCRNYSFHFE